MNAIMSYKGYTGTVEYSEEDGCFFGKVLDVDSLLSYEGQTTEELEKDFHNVINAYIRDMEMKSYKFPVIDMQKTGAKISSLMKFRGISVKDVQRYLGLASVQSVYRWRDGISIPTVDHLYALSEILNVPIDAILCGSKDIVENNICMDIYDTRLGIIWEYYQKIKRL